MKHYPSDLKYQIDHYDQMIEVGKKKLKESKAATKKAKEQLLRDTEMRDEMLKVLELLNIEKNSL